MGISIRAAVAAVALLAAMPAPGRAATEPVDPTPNQHRAVWVLQQDFDTTGALLAKSLDEFRKANLNVLCLQIQRRGYVLYPGGKCLPQLRVLNGREILAPAIREAHARGMKVEAWCEYGLYAYYTPDSKKDTSRGAWLDAHPDLVSVDTSGSPLIHNPNLGDFFALDPANPDAQNLLLDLLVEIVERYPFDGINLDRIRYATATHGFSDYDRTEFKADTGLDPDAMKPGDATWQRWREWRKGQLTQFMARASRRLREARPGLRITMATVPPESIDDLGQDWPEWLKRGYLDAAYPMLYGANPQPRFETVRQLTGNNPDVFAGLDLTPGFESFKRASQDWISSGGRGVVIWESAAARQHVGDLSANLFLEPAESPLYPAGAGH